MLNSVGDAQWRMSNLNIATLAFLSVTVVPTLVVIHLLRNKYGTGISHIPGPYFAGFSRLWRLGKLFNGQVMTFDTELHEKYGPLVRIGPKNVLLSDCESAKVVYAPSSGFSKTEFYAVQGPVLGGKLITRALFITSNIAEHAGLKRLVSTAYSATTLKNMEPQVDEVSDLFMDIVDQRFVQTRKPLNMGEYIQWYAFDVIGNLTFSKQFGFLREGKDVEGSINMIKQFMLYSSLAGQLPEVHFLLMGNPLVLKLMNPTHPIVQFTIKCIKERENASASAHPSDFLAQFQQLNKKKPDQFTETDLLLSTTSNVFAGSDTTAIAFRTVIFNLLTHPRCLDKLQVELDLARKEGRLSEKVSMDEGNALPYTQACIKEAMRLHPSVAYPLERRSPKGGATVAGAFIPEGVIVGVNPWVAGRDKSVYGDDAQDFRPERWLEASPGQLRAFERNMFVFGAGSRICIGRHISLMELSKMIPRLFVTYDMSLAVDPKEVKVATYWFAIQEGLIVNVKRRYQTR